MLHAQLHFTIGEIIEKINQHFKGNFTDKNRLMLTILADGVMKDEKLRKRAVSSDPQIFAESIFPSVFQIVAMDGYMNFQEGFASLFEDKALYYSIMSSMAEWTYRELRRGNRH